jgi:vacuolar-type H+-ATPase subunit I/STV1
MERNEEKSMRDEIIDSLAKKVTELENRQQKVENMELDKLRPRIKELETQAANYPTANILAYNQQIDQFGNQINNLDEKIKAVPKEIPVRHTHQFDTKSRYVIRTLVGLLAAVAVLIGVSVSLWIENNRRADEANKFLILRGFYPNVAKYIDTAYINNADFLIKKAKANIAEQQTMSEAAFAAKQAAEESKLADEKLKALKRKNQLIKKEQAKKQH